MITTLNEEIMYGHDSDRQKLEPLLKIVEMLLEEAFLPTRISLQDFIIVVEECFQFDKYINFS